MVLIFYSPIDSAKLCDLIFLVGLNLMETF